MVSQSRRAETTPRRKTTWVYVSNGEGVAKDQVEAVKWFRKAAEQNHAWLKTTWAYATKGRRRGEGSVEAVKWFRKAAEQKLPSLNTIWASATIGDRRGEGPGGGGEMVSQSRRAQ